MKEGDRGIIWAIITAFKYKEWSEPWSYPVRIAGLRTKLRSGDLPHMKKERDAQLYSVYPLRNNSCDGKWCRPSESQIRSVKFRSLRPHFVQIEQSCKPTSESESTWKESWCIHFESLREYDIYEYDAICIQQVSGDEASKLNMATSPYPIFPSILDDFMMRIFSYHFSIKERE